MQVERGLVYVENSLPSLYPLNQLYAELLSFLQDFIFLLEVAPVMILGLCEADTKLLVVPGKGCSSYLHFSKLSVKQDASLFK